MVGKKAVPWNKEATAELINYFNLFVATDRADGFDPEEFTHDYVFPEVQSCNNDTIKQYLSAQMGRHHNIKDNMKIICGYERAASEYIVFNVKKGNWQNQHPSSTLS